MSDKMFMIIRRIMVPGNILKTQLKNTAKLIF